ncbi:MAG: hypothetical protein HC875_11940 [Anaerolineales bacterium]|nr:hypothetical protein [Anaerolineales bacterium]
MKTISLTIACIVFTVLLVACGGGGSGAQKIEEKAPAEAAPKAQTVTLDIEMGDIYYGKTPDNATKPPVWEVTAGSTIKLNLKNNGALEHNWAIVKPGSEVPEPFIYEQSKDIILAETGLSPAGKTSNFDITAPLPDEYKVICTVAGHYPSMQGRLIVK